MKESEKYDPFIQQKLESLHFPDEHESWKRMELLLKKDKKRRPLFFIPIGCLGILLLTAGSIYLFYISHTIQKTSKKSTYNSDLSLKRNIPLNIKDNGTNHSRSIINPSNAIDNTIHYKKKKFSIKYANKKLLKINKPDFKVSENYMNKDAITHLVFSKPHLLQMNPKEKHISLLKLSDQIKEKQNAIILGLGMVQQIPINGQSFVPYGKDGRKLSVSDYLPYLYGVYNLNNKISLEAQFRYGAPNYVRQVIYNQQKIDSFANEVHTYRYTAQKTYYHQLQLSITYKLTNKIVLGTGIQYNFFNDATVKKDYVLKDLILNKESVINSYQLVANNDSFFTKQHFDVSLNINYQFKKFDLGIKTGMPLSSLLNYQDASGSLKQEKSWYLNIYVRAPLFKQQAHLKNAHH